MKIEKESGMMEFWINRCWRLPTQSAHILYSLLLYVFVCVYIHIHIYMYMRMRGGAAYVGFPTPATENSSCLYFYKFLF